MAERKGFVLFILNDSNILDHALKVFQIVMFIWAIQLTYKTVI